MKVAALQMVSGTQPHDNLDAARALLEQAADDGVELAVLPEYFSGMGATEFDKLARSEPFGDGEVQRFLRSAARDLGLWIVGGTLPLQSPEAGRVHNTTLVVDPQGECVARYDKIHLFHFDNGRERYEEARTVQAGNAPVQFDLPSRDGHRWRVGLSVCYDLRFPELYRAHARAGADLMLVPSAFTHTTGQAHWEVLLRSRAIENLAYVLAPAQGGHHENGRHTWGHSMLVDPWGAVLAQHAQGPSMVAGTVAIASLRAMRQQLPALAHQVL